MPNISVNDVRAWVDTSLLPVNTLETELEAQIGARIMAVIQEAYDTTTWTSPSSTPVLVRSVIAMIYASNLYEKAYAHEDGGARYALSLRQQAEALLRGIVDGSVLLPDAGQDPNAGEQPSFYPNDSSVELVGRKAVPVEPKFSMGILW